MLRRILVISAIIIELLHAGPRLQEAAGLDNEEYVQFLQETYPSLGVEPTASQKEVERALKEMGRRLKTADNRERAKFEVRRKVLTQARGQLDAWLSSIANVAAMPFRHPAVRAPKFRFPRELPKISNKVRACTVMLAAGLAVGPPPNPKPSTADAKVLIQHPVFLEGTTELAQPPQLEADSVGIWTGPSGLDLEDFNMQMIYDTKLPERGFQTLFDANPDHLRFLYLTTKGAMFEVTRNAKTEILTIHDMVATEYTSVSGRHHILTFDGRDLQYREDIDQSIQARKIVGVADGLAYEALDGQWYLHRLSWREAWGL